MLEAPDSRLQVLVVHVQAFRDGLQVLFLQVVARQDQAEGRVVIDDHAAFAIENLAARGEDRDGFDAVALGLLVVDFGAFDLQPPEPGDQEQKNANCGVLKKRDLAGGASEVVSAQAPLFNPFFLGFCFGRDLVDRCNYLLP